VGFAVEASANLMAIVNVRPSAKVFLRKYLFPWSENQLFKLYLTKIVASRTIMKDDFT
jgi:hypothetical protein